MKESSKKALFISAALHGLFFIGIAFTLLIQSCKSRKELHVFDLQTTAPEVIEQIAPKQTAPEPTVTKPAPKQKKEEPKLAKMTYEEFVKKQGLPKETKRPPKPVSAPKIDTSDIAKDLEKSLAKTDTKSPVLAPKMDPIKAYAKGLKDQVDAVWEKPIMTLGYRDHALVQFTVHTNGTISDIKIKNSSGSLDFDDSVKSAFQKVANVSPPPEGKTMTFELYFSLHNR